MHKKHFVILLLAIFIFSLTACNRELKNIIERDIMVFAEEKFSDEFINKISEYRVVMLGEYHGVKEHDQLVIDLIIKLNNKAGFNQLLLETPHALGWILEDYTAGHIEYLPDFFQSMGMIDLGQIKEHNKNLSDGVGITVHAYDINHNPTFLRASFDFLLKLEILEGKEIREFLKIYTEKSEEIKKDETIFISEVQVFLERLKENKDYFQGIWGELWYERIKEMLNYEIISFNCRKYLENNDVQKRTRLREDVMKDIVDVYIKEDSAKTLINTGLNHAQKKHFRGSDNEWLAEYLVYQGEFSRDNTYVIAVIPARGQLEWGRIGNYRNVDLISDSKRSELFRLIFEKADKQHAFLPLDDPLFKTKELNINYHFEEIRAIPQVIHDGIYILPEISPSR